MSRFILWESNDKDSLPNHKGKIIHVFEGNNFTYAGSLSDTLIKAPPGGKRQAFHVGIDCFVWVITSSSAEVLRVYSLRKA